MSLDHINRQLILDALEEFKDIPKARASSKNNLPFYICNNIAYVYNSNIKLALEEAVDRIKNEVFRDIRNKCDSCSKPKIYLSKIPKFIIENVEEDDNDESKNVKSIKLDAEVAVVDEALIEEITWQAL